MAGCAYTQMPWGYVCGGTDVDATEIFGTKARLKALAFAGNADDATCAITTKGLSGEYTDTIKFKTNGNDLDAGGNKMNWGPEGIPIHGLTVKLSHANDRLYVYLV